MPGKNSPEQRQQLVALVQYLNLEEMRYFCRKHTIPRMIRVETPSGKLRKTADRDRKDIVLRRILTYALDGKRQGPTVYAKHVVDSSPLPDRLTARTRLHYNQYEKHNPRFVRTLQGMTRERFRTGMIARLFLREFWLAGKAPTMHQFATAWMDASTAHIRPRAEGAYLVDRFDGLAGSDWKQVRKQKAADALRQLDALVRQAGTEDAG